MTWNYRIVLHDQELEATYRLHEVLYDEDGNISSISESPAAPMGESEEELIADIKMMLEDVSNADPLIWSELDFSKEEP